MEKPFVSVVIATMNRKELLQEVLGSLEKQSYPRSRFEVVVVDNRSQDGTWDWLNENADRFACDIKPVFNESDPTDPGSGRNIGIREASGEVIAFTDSDCVVSSEWLQKGVAAIEQQEADVVIGKTLPHPDDPRPALSTTAQILSGKTYGDTCNIFYRKRVLDTVGGFSEEFTVRFPYPAYYGDDVDLACRATEAGFRSVFAEEAVVFHHVRPLSVRRWLLEPRKLLTCPYLVKKYPRTRRELLFMRYFLTPMTALFDLLLLGGLLGWLVSPWFAVLGTPFVVAKFREGGEHLGIALRLVRVLASPVRATIIFVALALGSIRFGSLVI